MICKATILARSAAAGLAIAIALLPGGSIAQAPVPGDSGIAAENVGTREILRRQQEAYKAFQRGQKSQYDEFQEERSAEYEAFMARMQAQYARFQGIVEEEEEAETDRLSARWDEPELSSAKVWVEYGDDLAQRRRVDFESATISIESLDGSTDLRSKATLREQVRAIVTKNRAEAFADDRVAQAIEKRGKREIEFLETAVVQPRPIVWSYLTGESEIDEADVDGVVDALLARVSITESTTVSGEVLQQATIPLDTRTLLDQLEKLKAGDSPAPMPMDVPEAHAIPIPPRRAPNTPTPRPDAPAPSKSPTVKPRPRATVPSRPAPTRPVPAPNRPNARSTRSTSNRLPARARPFHAPVMRFGDRVSLEHALVFAIIETESAFNPIARSGAPAYGLMQIVPRSAGQDATQALYGKPRILAPSYLYNAENNIEIGTTFLDILLSRYLKGIRDPQSRLYCAIAAYNTGAGNVFRAFTGKTRPKAAFERINRMSAREVYRHLIWNLPYKETRHYLPKVVDRLTKYRGLVAQ